MSFVYRLVTADTGECSLRDSLIHMVVKGRLLRSSLQKHNTPGTLLWIIHTHRKDWSVLRVLAYRDPQTPLIKVVSSLWF